MNLDITITALSLLFIINGIFMSADGMQYKNDRKNAYIKNAEWGILIVLILQFFIVCLQMSMFLGFEVSPYLIIELRTCNQIIFAFVPINYWLYKRNCKKQEQQKLKNKKP